MQDDVARTHRTLFRAALQRRTVLAAFASAAMLLSSGASAQAGWGPPAPTNSHWHCSGYNTELGPVWFQECVVVTPGSAGASVQSVMAVTNHGSASADFLTARTITYLDRGVLISSDCGPIVIRGKTSKWCWGGTRPVAHGRHVQGRGTLAYGAVNWHNAWSPTWST